MKKIVVSTLALALGAMPAAFAARNDAYGKTFFTVRPQFQSESPEKNAGFRGLTDLRCDGWRGAIQIVPFGGRSVGSKGLGRYFSPFPKDSLFAQSNMGTDNDEIDVNARANGRDINPVNFGIDFATSFSSTIQFRPRQTVVGAGFEWRQYLGWWRDDCCPSNWWFALSGPVERVENDMRLTQTVVALGAQTPGTPASIAAAFTGQTSTELSGTGFRFGKINGKQRKTGFADLEVKLGYDYIIDECSYLQGYLGFVAPTGNRPDAEFVFEPIVGNNKNWGIMTGGYAGFELWGCGNHGVAVEMAMNTRYLFKNHQTRSFDLVNRPWSRYMPVFASATDALSDARTPGINAFTRGVSVSPHFQFNMNTALVYTHCGFQGEIGYNFWARQAESVKLREPFPAGVYVAGLAGNTTNLLNNIAINNTDADLDLTVFAAQAGALDVAETDIDFLSMSHPAALSNTVYGALGYNWDWCWPIYLGLGGSYEFSTNNVALSRWIAWGKLAISI